MVIITIDYWLDKPESFSFEEILTTCGHELGHIVDANEFQNSTAEYQTPEGYEQEETKALRFEKHVHDSYRMALLFTEMFQEIGIGVSNQ